MKKQSYFNIFLSKKIKQYFLKTLYYTKHVINALQYISIHDRAGLWEGQFMKFNMNLTVKGLTYYFQNQKDEIAK
jgi:hypothetical protein